MSDPYDDGLKMMMGACIAAILLCFYGCTMSINQAERDRAACESRGGVYHSIHKSRDLCLRSEDVIPMEEIAAEKEAEEDKPRVVKYKPRFQ